MVPVLRGVIGDYPHSWALRHDPHALADVRLECFDFKQAPDAFKTMLNGSGYDFCEMPIVTFLQAHALGYPLILLPVTMAARLPHGELICAAGRGHIELGDLTGRRIAMRSWARTTCVWLRGMLVNDYGLDVGTTRWITLEDSHVIEFPDPSERAPPGKSLSQMLHDGEVDVVAGEKPDGVRSKTVFADAEASGRQWRDRHGFVPINHMMVVTADLVQSAPDLVREFYGVLQRGRARAPDSRPDSLPVGIEENRKALARIIAYAAEQGVIPRQISLDDLFGEFARWL